MNRKQSGIGKRHKDKPKQMENLKKKSEISQPVASKLSNEKKKVGVHFSFLSIHSSISSVVCEPGRKNTRRGRFS